jgi:hypothetical protein
VAWGVLARGEVVVAPRTRVSARLLFVWLECEREEGRQSDRRWLLLPASPNRHVEMLRALG